MKENSLVIIRGKGPLPEWRWPLNQKGELLSIGEAAAILNELRWKSTSDLGPIEIEVLQIGRL